MVAAGVKVMRVEVSEAVGLGVTVPVVRAGVIWGAPVRVKAKVVMVGIGAGLVGRTGVFKPGWKGVIVNTGVFRDSIAWVACWGTSDVARSLMASPMTRKSSGRTTNPRGSML